MADTEESTEKPADLLSKDTESISGKLVWKEGVKGMTPGKEASLLAIAQKYGLTEMAEDELEALVTTVKSRKKKKSNNDAAGSIRAAEDAMVALTLKYLSKFIRILAKDNRVALYIQGQETLDMYKHNFQPTGPIALAEVMMILKEIDPDARNEWSAKLDKMVEDAAPLYGNSKKEPIRHSQVLMQSFTRILVDLAVEECYLPKDLPLMIWKREKEDKVKAFVELPADKLVKGEYPHIKRFLKRVNFPDELMAFVWKCFDPDEFGRQAVWSQSLGHSGQSTFWNVVYNKLRKVGVILQKASNTNNHTAYKLYLKRFAMVPDCGNRKFFETELARQMTGNDTADMEPKFLHSFAAQIYARLVVHSNFAPEVDTTNNAMKTRLLYFIVRPFDEAEADHDITTKYDEEFWHFLYDCCKVHKRMCKIGDGKFRDIPLPPEMWELMKLKCDNPINNICRKFIERGLVLDPDGEVYEEDLWKEFAPFYKKAMRNPSDFRETLKREKFRVQQTMNNIINSMIGKAIEDGEAGKKKKGDMKSGEFGERVYIGVRWVGLGPREEPKEDSGDLVL